MKRRVHSVAMVAALSLAAALPAYQAGAASERKAPMRIDCDDVGTPLVGATVAPDGTVECRYAAPRLYGRARVTAPGLLKPSAS